VIGCLAGIGFTMSIFISALAFEESPLLAVAKFGVLAGSVAAAVAGLLLGRLLLRPALD
jgi:NhaA family Na+:H+ antiporter